MNRQALFSLFLAVLTVPFAVPASAQQSLTGIFVASRACPAFQSLEKKTNPGNIRLTPHVAYELTGINKENGKFYSVTVPEAPKPRQRWVQTICGDRFVKALPAVTQVPAPKADDTDLVLGPESTSNVLALTWEPAFCEINPDKTECKAINNGEAGLSGRQLSLHGLWPQPDKNTYCDVSDDIKALDKPETWEKLPMPQLAPDAGQELARLMPGVASHLDHHEWVKHGTCFNAPGGGREYFADMMHLAAEVNASAVGSYLAKNGGTEVTAVDIRKMFNEAFGEGTGDRVDMRCARSDNRRLVTELRINLKGVISPESSLGDLMKKAPAVETSCTSGLLDLPGL